MINKNTISIAAIIAASSKDSRKKTKNVPDQAIYAKTATANLLLLTSLALMSFILLLTSLGCTSNYYVTANQLQARGNYVGAIDNYDEFIARTKDGAMKVKALNKRSESYYQMGIGQMDRGNYRLAIRLFYLANTLKADEQMVECYLTIADNAFQENKIEEVRSIYDFVINNYPILPVIPSVVYRRMLLNHNQEGDIDKVWSDYIILVDQYGDGNLIDKSIPIIDEYLPTLIDEAVSLKNSHNHNDAIRNLLMLQRYPHSFKDEIEHEVGKLFFEVADNNKKERDFFAAYENYLAAKSYNPGLEDQVAERLNNMVSMMVDQGNEYLEQRDINKALEIFELTFNIIPDNQLAKDAIERADQLAENIRVAEELFNRALRYEEEENYAEALRLYNQSYNRDRLSRTTNKIFLVTNLIEIENDPVGFARKIITEYNNGIIVRNINQIAAALRAVEGDGVRESGWRIMLSTGTNRYEVRYDITSRAENYFLVWQVNLLNRNIVPLNTQSREAME